MSVNESRLPSHTSHRLQLNNLQTEKLVGKDGIKFFDHEHVALHWGWYLDAPVTSCAHHHLLAM